MDHEKTLDFLKLVSIPTATIPYRYKSPLGSQGHFLPGAREIQRDPLRFALAMTQQYSDIARIRFLSWPAYLVKHPHGVRHVLEEIIATIPKTSTL